MAYRHYITVWSTGIGSRPGPGAGKEGGGRIRISTATDFSEGLEVSNNI